MKIILSRKGFDSKSGGIPSPIFEDGTMISFPIPSTVDKEKYTDLIYNNRNYADILMDLNYKGGPNCHIDPDLTLGRRKDKIENWCPIFGQINSSASYLLNTVNVEKGDIFLFFGNFHHVKMENGKYRYVTRTKDFYMDKDLQVIWGYLQVDKVITNPIEQGHYKWHPHSIEYRTNLSKTNNNNNNVMYVASKKLSFNSNMSGAGIFNYNSERVLTAENASKASWRYEEAYDENHIIKITRKNSSKRSDRIYYAGQWQELGLKDTPECENWAKRIIEI